MAETDVAIRDVDEEAWREFRAWVVENGRTTGETVSSALREYVNQQRRVRRHNKKPRNSTISTR